MPHFELGEANYDGTHPHTGVEMDRSGEERPVYNLERDTGPGAQGGIEPAVPHRVSNT